MKPLSAILVALGFGLIFMLPMSDNLSTRPLQTIWGAIKKVGIFFKEIAIFAFKKYNPDQ